MLNNALFRVEEIRDEKKKERKKERKKKKNKYGFEHTLVSCAGAG